MGTKSRPRNRLEQSEEDMMIITMMSTVLFVQSYAMTGYQTCVTAELVRQIHSVCCYVKETLLSPHV